jgi:hypothetical protein
VFLIASRNVKNGILISEERKVLSGREEWRLPLEHGSTSLRSSFLIQKCDLFPHSTRTVIIK